MQWTTSSRRLGSVFLLGFASGLPIALVASTLQAWLTQAGLPLMMIGVFAMVQQPYVYKFLWAPLIDRFPLPFLDRRRSWILLMQIALIVAFILMALINPKVNPMWLWFAALLTAFFSATQDIAYDAYRTDLLMAEERGLGSAFTTTGYRIAILISGALALAFAAHHGFPAAYLLMSVVMLIGVVTSLIAPRLQIAEQPPKTTASAFIEPIKEFISRRQWLLILLLVVLYKLSDAFTLSLSTTFLLRGLHFSLVDLAVVNKTGAMLAAIAGGFVAGILMVRMRFFAALFLFAILQTLAGLGYMVLAIVGKKFMVMAAAVMVEYFFSGMGTIAFVALLMALCDHRYTAAQFALFGAIDSAARVFIGPLSAFMVAKLGWAPFYFWAVIAGMPAILVLYLLRRYIASLEVVRA